VWTGNDDERNRPASVGKVDPHTNQLVGTVEARSPQSITFGHGAVWVADHAGLLVKIDPETVRVLASERLQFGAHGVIATKWAVYVADAHDHRLLVADPRTARIRRVVDLPIGPIYPVLGGGSLWTTSETTWSDPSLEDDRVARIDPRTLRVVQTLHLGSNAPSLTFGFGSVWVALRSGVVERLRR
jgi:DNA-binding beta-propeller fold protein YncE